MQPLFKYMKTNRHPYSLPITILIMENYLKNVTINVEYCNTKTTGGCKMRKIMIPVMSILLLALIVAGIYSINKPKKELSYPAFLEAVNNGQVQEVIYSEEGANFEAYLKEEANTKYEVTNPKSENFVEFLC